MFKFLKMPVIIVLWEVNLLSVIFIDWNECNPNFIKSRIQYMSLLTFLPLALRPRDTAEENASWRKPSTG